MKIRIKKLTYFLFGVSNIQLLINPGVFWDDWTLYKSSVEAIMSLFIGNGSVYFGLLHQYLQSTINPVLIYSIITIVLQILSIYFLFKVIKLFEKKVSKELRFLYILVMIYAVLPFADTKITMICFPYTLCLSFFIFGCYTLVKYVLFKRTIYRIVSSVFFVLSFTTASFLFFYLVPIIFILMREEIYDIYRDGAEKLGYGIKKLVFKGLKHFELLLLPLIFFLLKSFLFPIRNQYQDGGYNEINLGEISQIPARFLLMFKTLIVTGIPYFTELFTNLEYVIILILLFVLLFFKIPNLKKVKVDSIFLFGIGLFILFVGAFPYLLVNKIPTFSEYNSRHALLIGFGFAIMIIGLLFLFKHELMKKLILSFVISICVTLNVIIQFNYFKGFILEQIYTNIFAEISQEIGDVTTTVLVHSNATEFTSKGAHSRFYSLSGIYKKINSSEKVMLILEKDYESYIKVGFLKKLEPYFYQYNLKNYTLVEPKYELKIILNKDIVPQNQFLTYYYQFFTGNKDNWDKFFTYEFKLLTK